MAKELTDEDIVFITSKPTGELHKTGALKKIMVPVIKQHNGLIDITSQRINQARSGLANQIVPHRFI